MLWLRALAHVPCRSVRAVVIIGGVVVVAVVAAVVVLVVLVVGLHVIGVRSPSIRLQRPFRSKHTILNITAWVIIRLEIAPGYRSRERGVEGRKDEKDIEGYHIPSHFVGHVKLIRKRCSLNSQGELRSKGKHKVQELMEKGVREKRFELTGYISAYANGRPLT
ncbi:hypothetical protein BGY98DRAFT_1013194 [Russula aff. rugulosa BPL654]|nr:hypothetical protein BGY98DRAFT_1013194 [Russula aff. rugulosa BPL654]